MAASRKIVELRNLVAARFPHPAPAPLSRLATGIECLDDTIGGGLPKGAITEITSPHPSAGSALLVAALLHAAGRDRYFVALVDGRDSFDPEPLGNSILRKLLWLRCQNGTEGLKAADLLLRDGNFPLVILDLVLNPAKQLRRIPQTSWYRLQRLVEPTPTAFLVFTRQSMISSAQLKLVLGNSWRLEDLNQPGSALLSRLRIQVRKAHFSTAAVEMPIAEAG